MNIRLVIFFGFMVVCGFFLIRSARFIYQNFRGLRSAFGPIVKSGTSSTTLSKTSLDTTGLGFTVPSGFQVSTFAKDVPNARVLALDPSGTLLVSEPSQGKIVALIDADNDGVSEKKVTVVEGLNLPHGLAFKERVYPV